MQERVEGPRSDAITVMRQLLHHGQSKNGFMRRMDEDMNPYKTGK
jgi:hypothetical protein